MECGYPLFFFPSQDESFSIMILAISFVRMESTLSYPITT